TEGAQQAEGGVLDAEGFCLGWLAGRHVGDSWNVFSRHCEERLVRRSSKSEGGSDEASTSPRGDTWIASLPSHWRWLPRRGALHGGLAFRIRGPHLHAAAGIVIGIDRELAAFEQRLHAAIDEFLRRLAAVQFRREFDDERRLQRAVEHEARITF